jgi:hypothetical protein
MKKIFIFGFVFIVSNNFSSLAADDLFRISSDEANNLLFPTALTPPEKINQIKGHYLLSWEYSRSLGNGVSAGGRMLAPLGVLGGGPKLKFVHSLGDNIHFGVYGEVGGVVSMYKIGNQGSQLGFYYMGGQMLTFGDHEFAVTIGPAILGGGYERRVDLYYDSSSYERNEGNRVEYNHIIVGNLNLHKRFTPAIKGMIDFTLPIAHKSGFLREKAALLGYGVRIGGESLSGDIGFVLPIHSEMGSMMRTLPLGFPIISLNINF